MAARFIAMYMRVSTSRQDLRSQEPDLKAWVEKEAGDRRVVWYRDKHTGRSMDRPALKRLERYLRAGKIETLVVWRNDRLGRRMRHLLGFLEELDELQVRYVSLKDGGLLNGDSASGRAFRSMLAVFSQYESDLISERTLAGQAAARKRGITWGGRKPGHRYRLTPERLQALKAMLDQGLSKTAISRQLGISRSTVYEGLKLLVELKED